MGVVLNGVYDATVIHNGGSSDTIGNVATETDGTAFVSVALGNDASASFGGPVAADGTMRGEGTLLVTDIVFQDSGEAVFSDDAGVRTIAGSIVAPEASGFGGTITFTMRRPADADASAFSGTYRFQFAPSPSGCGCASTLDLTLTVGRSGEGMAGGGIERDHDGASLASVSEAFLSLSPQGRARINVGYAPVMIAPPFCCTVELIGTVDASGAIVTASGATFVGFTPATDVGGWTAERLP
jgi:hypothetical protein